jgi:hypothetical protein
MLAFQNVCPNSWKQAAIIRVFKICRMYCLGKYRRTAVLNNFSIVFELIKHDHMSHFLKFEVNYYQHDFNTPISTVNNLVTFRYPLLL